MEGGIGHKLSFMQPSPRINAASQSYYAKRVRNDIHEVLEGSGERIDFGEFVEILRRLSFLREKGCGTNSAESSSVLELWNQLALDQETIPRAALTESLLQIMGATQAFKQERMAVSSEKEEIAGNRGNETQHFHIERKRRDDKFAIFKINRLRVSRPEASFTQELLKPSETEEKRTRHTMTTRKSRSPRDFTFTPKISRSSIKYAESARKRALLDVSGLNASAACISTSFMAACEQSQSE